MLSNPNRMKIILNFACIYLVWGSTYLAIKYAILGNPPFLIIGLRFLLGSTILFLIGRAKKESYLKWIDVKIAALSGVLLVLGNALVAFAEKDTSSSLVAVVVGSMPAWIMLFNWKFFSGSKPQVRQVTGVVISLTGVLFLTLSKAGSSGEGSLISWITLALSLVSWAFGTLIQRKAVSKESLFTFSGVQLGIGGVVLLLGWMLLGDTGQTHLRDMSMISILAGLYLALVGTVLAFTSYLWLNRNVEPTTASTYALVNPVVAVWLGWLIADETITSQTLMFSVIVIAGVYWVIFKPKPKAVLEIKVSRSA
jgi:drug/metabolite transporter (DMT)-like permease